MVDDTHPDLPRWFRCEEPASDLPPDIYDSIASVTEKSGFTPNVYCLLSYFPEQFRAFFAYHDAIMGHPCSLTAAEREMIVVSTSASNNCLYCVVAHGAILRIRSKSPQLSDQISVDFAKADIPQRQLAMLQFAHKVAHLANRIEPADLQKLRDQNFSDDDIFTIGSIAAFFALSNRLAGLSDLRPNSEFYSLGR